MIKETGAKYMVMDGDVPVVESGGTVDFAYGDSPYPKAKVDRVLHDGDEVSSATPCWLLTRRRVTRGAARPGR